MVCAERVRDDRMPLRKVLSGQRGAGSILLAGVIPAPCQIIFQDHRGADCIQDGFALFAKGAVVPQDAGGGDGGLALIPHPHRQSALLLHDGSQLAALLGTAPSVPSMFRGSPTTIFWARLVWAASQIFAATLTMDFSSIWGFKGVASSSLGSLMARPVRLSP